MDVAEDAEGALDPRIQIELENLNNATDDINKLETELDEAHTAFRQLLSDVTRRLKEITDKLGTSCIEKARCYYEAFEIAHQARVQCQQQAQLFQRASEIHAAAKETVALAEARFMSHQHEWNFDQAWQDMLNHATIKVMDADNQKAECGREHHRRAMLFHDAKKKLLQLEEKHRRSIIKARPYFEMKTQCDQMLATQKERIEYLQKTIKEAKCNYATSLRTLEEISNQIHQQRRDYDIVVNGPREPGVGAELISSDTCQKRENEFNSSDSHKISSVRYNENRNNENLHDIENLHEKPCLTKEDVEKLDKRSVDGSESKSTQWELELQASMEKLNRLSLESSLYLKERHNALSSVDLRNAIEVNNMTPACYDILLAGQSNAYNLNQFSILTKVTLEKDMFIYGSSSLPRSCSITTGDSPKIALKSNISKSLNSSPVNRNVSSFKNEKITEKAASIELSKYVPKEKIAQSDIKSRRTQSSEHINVPHEIDAACKDQTGDECNANDDVFNANNVESTNLPYAQAARTVDFLHAESDLLEEYHSAASSDCVSRHSVRSQDDATLLPIWSSSNVLQKSASYSANTSPMKLRNLLTSSARSSDSETVEQRFHERSASKELVIKTASTQELPLLSLFGRASTLSTIRGKSCSMIDLDDKRNLKTLLDNSRLSDIQAISAERLANVRHRLVNDHSVMKMTDNVKK